MTILPSSSFLRTAPALIVLLFMTAACDCLECFSDDATYSANTTTSASSFVQLAPMAPPEPLYEEKPFNDNPRNMTWRQGYWEYTGGDFHWVAGEYIDRPSPTAIWAPDHWLRHDYGWAFVPGYWQ